MRPLAMMALLLAVGGPLFIALPLTADAALYDVQARIALQGGVLYRDAFEPNLPGIVWCHIAIRSVLGWSSEALRLVDLAVFCVIAALLGRLVGRLAGVPAAGAWAAAIALWFYLSTSEWCHCQRDTWMLLPALVAFGLRTSQLRRLWESVPGRSLFVWGMIEGLCWGAAFWLKPFVAVPAAVCLVSSAGGARERSSGESRLNGSRHLRWRPLATDWFGVLTGGAAIGAVGVLWLVFSGAWPSFVKTLVEWNPDYFAAGRDRWTWGRADQLARSLSPWIWLHVAAVPLAVRVLWRRHAGTSAEARLLPALYLGWLAQAVLLQHPFDYVHAPAIVLAIATVVGAAARACSATKGSDPFAVHPFPLVPIARPQRGLTPCGAGSSAGLKLLAVAFIAAAIATSPLTTWSTPSSLAASFTQLGSADLRDRLCRTAAVSWRDLAAVADFLRSQKVRNGEVTCWNGHLVHLYRALGIRPSTRYVYLDVLTSLFPGRRGTIEEAMRSSGHRFVVECRQPSSRRSGTLLSEWRSHPIVFRAGPYVVRRTSPN
ncbi:MAG: hypothetical protein KY476_24285 [Planctomycetes bacterium]|nr:hypothetical protein [Planctomycetota bacterium]